MREGGKRDKSSGARQGTGPESGAAQGRFQWSESLVDAGLWGRFRVGWMAGLIAGGGKACEPVTFRDGSAAVGSGQVLHCNVL